LTRRANQRHHPIIAQFVKPPMALPQPGGENLPGAISFALVEKERFAHREP
jgi:hypothetical protein